METVTRQDAINKLEEIVSKFENKDFNVYFFVVDTKNAPNGGVEYMYDIALNLHDKGYNVTMLHQEQEFVGPIEWLGERYSVLEHKNVESNNVAISAADFLFIPEVYVNVMTQTKNLPCKRILVYHTPEYMLEFMPVGATLSDLNMYDAITTNSTLKNQLEKYFPRVKTRVIRPSVKKCFYTTDEPKKLIVNLMGADQSDINNIIKPFFWKNPAYKWVSFRDVRNMAQTVFADVLREGFVSVWVDDKTSNAQVALEALKSGNILIAKVPENIPEWMLENGELRNDVIWFTTFDELHQILASVIRGWTRNDIVSSFTNVYEKLNGVYTPEAQNADIEVDIIKGIFEVRFNEYKQLLLGMKDKVENE